MVGFIMVKKIKIFTDGACSPNPGAGGWGIVFLYEGKKPFYQNGGEPNTTNNKMELMAALTALQTLKTPHKVQLFTDSKYVQDGITKWLPSWKERNWQTAAKQPVKNKDLWQQLDKAAAAHQVEWHWVKGHAANKWNEMADQLAVAGRTALACPPPASNKTIAKTTEQTDIIKIYAGITWRHKDQQGSWAIIFTYRRYIKVLAERADNSSANRLHIQTAINALSLLKKNLPVQFYTTSGYLKSGADTWLAAWQQRGWRTKDNKQVSNQAQWQQLAELLKQYRVNFILIDKTKDDNPCHSLAAKEIAKQTAT
jgi:ribonuclease HI